MYEPQVGDRVRRTYSDGTIIEGVIARAGDRQAESAGGLALYTKALSEQTVLLERPVKLNTEPGAVYGSPHSSDFFSRVVRVGIRSTFPWLGSTGSGDLWHIHEEVERLVRNHGWVEYNLDGSKK